MAKLAGLPNSIINRASDILSIYEAKEQKRDVKIQTTLPLDYVNLESEVEKELEKLNVLEISPMQALNILYDLKNKVKK